MDGLSSLLSNLSAEDIESLKAAASSLMGDASSDNAEYSENEEETIASESQSENNPGGFSINPEDIAMISRISGLMSSSGKKNDYRANLLIALKPLLSEKRQKRADEAIRIIRLLDMLPLLKESGLLSDFFK